MLNVENAVAFLLVADRHGASTLKSKATEFILFKKNEVKATESFQELLRSHNPVLLSELLYICEFKITFVIRESGLHSVAQLQIG